MYITFSAHTTCTKGIVIYTLKSHNHSPSMKKNTSVLLSVKKNTSVLGHT